MRTPPSNRARCRNSACSDRPGVQKARRSPSAAAAWTPSSSRPGAETATVLIGRAYKGPQITVDRCVDTPFEPARRRNRACSDWPRGKKHLTRRPEFAIIFEYPGAAARCGARQLNREHYSRGRRGRTRKFAARWPIRPPRMAWRRDLPGVCIRLLSAYLASKSCIFPKGLQGGAGQLNREMYSRGRKREHSKVCSPLADSSVRNGVAAGFPRGMHPVFIRLSCIEILHFSERLARRCWKN